MTVFQVECHLKTTDYCMLTGKRSQEKVFQVIIKQAVVNSINIYTVKVLFFIND